MPKKIKKAITSNSGISFLYRAIRGYSSTFRFTVENERVWMDQVESGRAVLLCCWHQQFFPAIRHFGNYRIYNPPLMISKSGDGEVIAGVASRTGWDIVRGSSSSGGRRAMKQMADKLGKSRIGAHIVDGPRGPAGQLKAGAIRLAQLADAVIVPFYTCAENAFYFNSWDRFMIPKPFSRVLLRFGEVFPVPETPTTESFERLRLALENVMLQAMPPHQQPK